MGAELILAVLPAARLTPVRRRRLHTLADRLPDHQLRCVELEDAAEDEDRRQTLHRQIDLLPADPDIEREVAVLQFTSRSLPRMVTGGLSWGDAPTDLFPTFCAVGAFPGLVRQLAAWARLDVR